jgi:HK97 family phage portal protein
MIKGAVRKWLGIPISTTGSAFWGLWSEARSLSGETVNEKTVMSLSTAYSCVKLIGETTATLPLHIYKKTKDGGRELANDYPIAHIIRHKPNINSTAIVFWQSMVASALLHGNGFAKIQRVGKRIVGLKFIHMDNIEIEENENGNLEFYEKKNNTKKIIANEDLFHLCGFSLDGRLGISAIEYGAEVFGSGIASSNVANSTFKKGLNSTVAFMMDKFLNDAQRVKMRESIDAMSGAMNAGRSPILEGGMEAKTISMNPKDAQLLESRQYSVEEICRWFGVDPSLVGRSGAVSNWGTGLEQKMIGLLKFTLAPWIARLEQTINNTLIPIEDRDIYYAEFNIEGLLRADSKARADFYATMLREGAMTRNEVRSLENLPKMDNNANELMVNSATQPIDTLGANTNE